MKKKKRRKIKVGRVIILLIPVIALLIAILFSINLLINIINNQTRDIDMCKFDESKYIKMSIDLNSKYYLVSKEGQDKNYIVYENGSKERIYPASLTKIMTMYVVLNNINQDDMDKMISVSYKDLDGLIEANASVLGLNVNDTISIKDALYGLILPSGADCANLLKRVIEEKGIDFISEMNRLASEIGMKDTHFSNPTGLFDKENYTTLYDMNLLMHEVFKYDIAKEILSSISYSDDGYTFISTMYRYKDYYNFDNATILGGKTGFTLESHLNLAAVASCKYGTIFILLGNADENGQDGMASHIMDAIKIVENYYQ